MLIKRKAIYVISKIHTDHNAKWENEKSIEVGKSTFAAGSQTEPKQFCSAKNPETSEKFLMKSELFTTIVELLNC